MFSLASSVLASLFATMLFTGGVFMNLSASVASTTATVINAPTEITQFSVSGNVSNPTSNTQRTITLSGIISDQNGSGDIVNMDMALYRDKITNNETCTPDPNNCYQITTCIINRGYGLDTEASFICTATIPDPYTHGTWKATATVYDILNDSIQESISFIVKPATKDKGYRTGSRAPEVVSPIIIGVPPIDVSDAYNVYTTDSESHIEYRDDYIDFDPITAFYKRIDKPEPLTRNRTHHTESYNEPLIVRTEDTGLGVFDFKLIHTKDRTTTLGLTIEVPAGVSREWLRIYVETLDAEPFFRKQGITIGQRQGTISQALLGAATMPSISLGEENGISPIGLTVFKTYAEDQTGRIFTKLSGEVRITFIVPEELTQYKDNLTLYRLDEDLNTWKKEAYDENDAYTLSFKTDTLGYFILANTPPTHSITTITQADLFCSILIIILLLIIIGILILMIITIIRGDDIEEDRMQSRDETHPEKKAHT